MRSSEWREVSLEELAEHISRGIAPSYTEDNGVIVINQKCIRDNRINLELARLTNPQKRKIPEQKYLKLYDILINSTGVGTLGRVAQVKKIQKKMTVDSHVTIVRPNDKVNPQYLGYNLFMQQRNIENLAEGSTGQTELSRRRLGEAIKLKLPSLEEQRQIANILSSLDEKIEINNKINKKLEEMAQAIFKHWFVDFEFPNENGEPYKSSGGEMVESELGMIPKGWKIKILDNIVGISTKSINPQNYTERVFEHYSIPALDNNKTPEIQMGKEIKSNKYIIDNNVILISKLNPTTKRIWKPAPQNEFAICSTEFIVYVPKENNIFYYVYEFINSDYFSEMLVSHATGSTGSRQRVKPKDTLSFKIYVPPVELMVNFSKAVKPMHDSVSLKNLETQRLVSIRDTLLPKLMSGEIRVPVEE